MQSLHDIACGEDCVPWNRDTINDANSLPSAVEKFSFLLTLVVVFNVLGYIKGLTLLLQQRSLDIVHRIQLVQNVQVQLKQVCDDIDTWHNIWFRSATDIPQNVGTELPSIPRRCQRQTHQANVEGETPEVYYRRSLTIPFLDHLLKELEDRFSSNAKVATSVGSAWFPVLCSKELIWKQM